MLTEKESERRFERGLDQAERLVTSIASAMREFAERELLAYKAGLIKELDKIEKTQHHAELQRFIERLKNES